MQMIEIEKLIPHPRNREFFDDIQGDRWEDFKESITRRGVVEGIVVTQDLIIVSGHQRAQACRELGIVAVPCRINHYPDSDLQTGNPKDDQILEDLICTNLMQRGVGNVNPMKMAKCIMELERIYGIKNGGGVFGGNQFTLEELPQNAKAPTQKDLADQLNISVDQIHRYKQLLKLVPDLQDLMVGEGNEKIKPSIAYNILSKLSPDEQQELLDKLGKSILTSKPGKEIQRQVALYKKEKEDLENKNKDLLDTINSIKDMKPQIVHREIMKEVVPEHVKTQLESLKNDNKSKDSNITSIQNSLAKLIDEKKKLEEYIESDKFEILSNQRELELLAQKEQLVKTKAHIGLYELKSKISKFINDAAPDIYLQGSMTVLDNSIKKDLHESLAALKMYTSNLEDVLNGNVINTNKNNKDIIDI